MTIHKMHVILGYESTCDYCKEKLFPGTPITRMRYERIPNSMQAADSFTADYHKGHWLEDVENKVD